MGKGTVVQIVSGKVKPFLEEKNYELVDIEFVKEGPHRYLRVYIDKEGGVSLDDCQEVSTFLNQKLDEIDPIEENYYLEVSSPGVERILKKDSDFIKFIGKKVQIKLYKTINGQKIVTGTLVDYIDKQIIVEVDLAEDNIVIPKDMAASVKLVAEFK